MDRALPRVEDGLKRVKVKEDWRNRPNLLKDFGYDV